MKSHFAAIKLMAEEGNNKIVEIPTVAEGFHSRKDFDVEIEMPFLLQMQLNCLLKHD